MAETHERMHASAAAARRAAETELRRRGERLTAPRRAVLEVLAARAEHLTADEVAALVGPAVHRATVYRTLDMLAATGIVTHQHLAGGATRYHLSATAAGHEHLHGHCQGCGQVVVLPPDALDAAAARMLAVSGFVLDVGRTALSGVCASCAASPGDVQSASVSASGRGPASESSSD